MSLGFKRLRPHIFLTLSTTRVVVRQPYAPAAFIPGVIPGTHFQRLSRPQGTWFCRGYNENFPVTPPGIDPGTVRLAQCLNQYAKIMYRMYSIRAGGHANMTQGVGSRGNKCWCQQLSEISVDELLHVTASRGHHQLLYKNKCTVTCMKFLLVTLRYHCFT